jgi:hypothetical protein
MKAAASSESRFLPGSRAGVVRLAAAILLSVLVGWTATAQVAAEDPPPLPPESLRLQAELGALGAGLNDGRADVALEGVLRGRMRDAILDALDPLLPVPLAGRREAEGAPAFAAAREIARRAQVRGTGEVRAAVARMAEGDPAALDGIGERLIEGAGRDAIDGAIAALQARDPFGLAHLEIAYDLRANRRPSFSVLAVKPLHDDARRGEVVFVQGSLARGADDTTINLGLAYRRLLGDGLWLGGANVFFDRALRQGLNRASIGLDLRSDRFTLSANRYLGLGGWQPGRPGYEARALSGHDLELSGSLPGLAHLSLSGRLYGWDGASPISGREIALIYAPGPHLNARLGYADEGEGGSGLRAALAARYVFGVPAAAQFAAPAADRASVWDRRFENAGAAVSDTVVKTSVLDCTDPAALGGATAGMACADGSIYAGSLNGNHLITHVSGCGYEPGGTISTKAGAAFTPTCSGATDFVWKNWADSNGANEGANSLTDGRFNTNQLMADAQRLNPAAAYCHHMDLNGKTDWYLPAWDELNVLFTHRTAIGGFTGHCYWSSSEPFDFGARIQCFQNGERTNGYKTASYPLRCIRTATPPPAAPSGYGVAFTTDPPNAGNASAGAFQITGAEVGAAFSYAVTSSGGGSAIRGAGAVASATHSVSGLNLSSLPDGVLTVSVVLTNAGGSGAAATDTVAKDTSAPAGHGVAFTTDPVNAGNAAAGAFEITSAEVGASYSYTITSDGGAGNKSGSGTISSATETVSGIELAALADGTLTVEVVLTDAAGNAGAAVTDTVVMDRVVPVIVSVTPPADGTYDDEP